MVDYLKTQEASNAIKTQLVATVVQGYYNLLMLDKQLEITKQNLTYSENTLAFLQKQQEVGLTTALAVQQQEIVKDQLIKSIPAIESLIATQENALNILCGEMPDKIERNTSLDEVELPENLSSGIPTELLSYRPDIKSAELDVRKSISAINVEQANLYPTFNITAQGGLNTFKASNWFNIIRNFTNSF